MVDDAWLKRWFVEQVLPLEPALNRFIQRHWPDAGEVADIRQDIYEKMLIKASEAQPANVRAYLFAVARNTITDRWRGRHPERTETGLDFAVEAEMEADLLTPERYFEAREELTRFEAGMRNLPNRCREVIRLRKVEGLSAKEVAAHMGLGLDSVHHQTMLGMRSLVDFLLGGDGRIQRPSRSARNKVAGS
jgi:RNA polymerase sigma-70 factor (ECF subfamily)